MGATGGGVWKTENYGADWYPVSDGYFGTGSIGAIRVAPSDPEVIYVGTDLGVFFSPDTDSSSLETRSTSPGFRYRM